MGDDVVMVEDPSAPAAMATTSGISPQHFDLEAYINKYTGHTKIVRLIFIAEKSESLRNDAYKLALDEIKHTSNACDVFLAQARPSSNFSARAISRLPRNASGCRTLYTDVVAKAIQADPSLCVPSSSSSEVGLARLIAAPGASLFDPSVLSQVC